MPITPVTVPNTFAALTAPLETMLDDNYVALQSAINNPMTPSNYLVDTGAANAYVVAFAAGITPTLTAGLEIQVLISHLNTGASTINVNGLGATNIKRLDGTALQAGDLPAGALVSLQYDGVNFQLQSLPQLSPPVLRSYLAGLALSTAGGSTTMSIAAGQAVDSTNTVAMNIAAFTKTTASWTLGSAGGGLDTGSTGGAASTWYYWYVIRRPDTGVVDLIFSLSSSAPTLPANYTQYRYIGAGFLDGSKNWTAFTQMGREFWWSTPVLDFNGSGSATAALLSCSIPHGRKMKGFFNLSQTSNANSEIYISDPSNADLAPSNTTAPISSYSAAGTGITVTGFASCWTNTSGQIRHREASTPTTYICTLGWLDLADTNL